MAKITTLQELETYWSMVDVLDAHEALDIQEIVSSQPAAE